MRTRPPPRRALPAAGVVGAVRVSPPEQVGIAVGTRVVRGPRPGSALVVAGTVDQLRDVVVGPLATYRVRRVRVVVAYWRWPYQNWAQGVTPIRHLVRHRVALPRFVRGPASVTMRLAKPVPLGEVVRSALGALGPTQPYPAAVAAPAPPPAGDPVVFDATRFNARGRRAHAYAPDAPRVTFTARDLRAFDAGTLARLRHAATVDLSTVDSDDPRDTARLVAALTATGVRVSAPDLPADARALLAPELLAILDEPEPGPDPLAAEARSVRQRRAALRHHAEPFGAAPFAGRAVPTVSAILATRRPDLVGPALAMLAGQTYPRLEIVLCLHGVAAPPGLDALLAGTGRPVTLVEVPATAAFGEALGAATARASGDLLTKVDDDDTYGPEHVWDLVLARHYSGATLVGKGSEFVHLEDHGTVIRRVSGVPEAFGEMVSGGTMLLATADVAAVGGWRPVARSVDLGLIQRLRRAGATIYRTHALGYVYHRRGTGHTWDPGEAYFLDAAYATWPSIPPDALA